MALLFIDNKQITNIPNVSEDTNQNDKVEKNITKSEISEDAVPEDEDNSQDINKIKINNALSGANKELKKEFLEQYKNINEYVSVKEYNAISALMIKATPEVVSDKTVLFTFKNSFEVVLFDKNIQDIQKLIKVVYNKKYDLVSVTSEEWDKIREEYIKNIKSGKKYEYIEIKEKKVSNSKNTELQNSLESIFGSDYITM